MVNNDVSERTALITPQVTVESKSSLNLKLLPAIFIVFFAWSLSATIIPNQLLKRACVYKGFNQTDCVNLAMHNVTLKIEEEIQPLVAKILMTIAVMSGVIPGCLSLFLGPWTDKFGRKKVIIAGYFGHVLALAWLCLISLFADNLTAVNPWIYLLPYLPVIFTGGWPAMIISTLCYVTDLSNDKNRSVQLAITEMTINLGILIGIGSCSFVLKYSHPAAVFFMSTILTFFATIYTIVFVGESVKEQKRASSLEKIREIISPSAVKETFNTCFKKRPGNSRAVIWCLLMIMVFIVSSTNAQHNVYYLFVREKFQWSLKEASLFDSLSRLISILGSMLALTVFKKIINVPDIILAILAITSLLADSLITAGAQSIQTMYTASFISMLKFLALPMCRSLMASIVPKHEIGKVYGFTSSFEAVATLFVSPLYTFVYSKTFTVLAGAFYFITAIVCLINFALISIVMRLKPGTLVARV